MRSRLLGALTSCMMLALAAVPATARAETVITATNQPFDQQVGEAMTALAVRATLIDKLGSDALGITVTVIGKTATLTGDVADPSSRGMAEQVALSVDGITRVENQVTAANPAMAATPSGQDAVKNALLETKVKGALLTAVGVNAFSIDVTARDGRVSLRGKPDTRETASVAVRKAESVDGVKNVVDLLE